MEGMSEKSPRSGDNKKTTPREERLKKALKANLQRRKAQARARGGAQGPDTDR